MVITLAILKVVYKLTLAKIQMARRKKVEEHINHERWLVSYADFITLLFAFFVVMYSISSVNEGKYRVLSDTLEATFTAPKKSMDPIQIGEVSRGQGDKTPDHLSVNTPESVIDLPKVEDHSQHQSKMQLF